MTERFFIRIKRNYPSLWKLAEQINNLFLGILHGKKIGTVQKKYVTTGLFHGFGFRLLGRNDLPVLHSFFGALDAKEFQFFRPHGFDVPSLERVLGKRLFLPFGVFDGDTLAGYCFLRLFFTGSAFIGRIVHPDYRGRKIGQAMGLFLQQVSGEINFSLYSTISAENSSSLISHQKNRNMEIVKELGDGYMLVKFCRKK